jgi:Skp family chaperone for outer membrane proteins
MSRYRYANRRNTPAYLALVFVLTLGGCQSMYYGAMEKMGVEKRDILVDRVDNAREAQQEAKEQFESALEKFIAVTNYSGGDLEKQYKTLKSEYEDSVSRADAVRDKISSVEDVADALFKEWEGELKEYSSAELRRSSERQLKATRKSYSALITAMKAAEKKIDPVLAAFNDRVLYLKHNLNANAIASLKTQRKSVETDIQSLIRDMNKSIVEADKFIKSMSKK